ncbi:MAG: DEAD/DEAH box helicase [Polyangiaceae bacterium]|nr:DEAD/DEAH box helicase [Polyangiaceae bacterium]
MPLPQSFHPAVRSWFDRTYAGPTSEQLRSWDRIRAGDDVLVAAPTGSGKTLCAFLAAIDELTRRPATSDQPKGIDVIYVSPLKALSSDVQKNLVGPLEGIRTSAIELGLEPPPISVALRTGDSTNRERAAILREAPHILVTTPESLYLMLTAKRSRMQLETVRWVIVDELHALMRDKRGSHLALSLSRLDAVAKSRPQRIGLSATVHPIAEAARFLSGTGERTTSIVDGGHGRSLEISVEVPSTDLGAVATNEQWAEIHNRIAKAIEEHRTTLVFVNTRRQAERVAHQLQERLGEDKVCAHHGSLSKERRLSIESRLKAGDMRAIVATASLELGIDVGSVDLVCQIGSPRAMTTFLQRIGRAGHGLGRTSKGMLLPTSRDDLAECAALVRGIRRGNLDKIEPPDAPLDVLAQQIVAECAARPWDLDELYALFTCATPYAMLTRSSFDEIVAMLVEGPAPRLGRRGALLHLDGVNGVAKGRRAARLVALTNGGAIPELADYRVVLDPDETFLGTVNEDWAIESQAGDVFVLGSHSWRIRRVESRRGVLRVVDAAGAPPSIPFWLGEAPARTWEHSIEVSGLRAAIVQAIDAGDSAVEWVKEACSLSQSAAEQLVAYVSAQRDALGVIPTTNDIVFERFFDESGGMQLVVHAPFGGRVNRAFGLALRKRFCVGFDFELQAAATDDAVLLSLGAQHSFPLADAFHFLRAHQVDESLQQAALRAPMFEVRWRWNATRSLAVLRREANRKVQPFLQRMRADDLLAAVFPGQVQCQENATGPIEVPDHPLVTQTIRDCLYEAMDTIRLKSLLEDMEHGRIRMHARDTTEPSPFSHEILNSKPYTFLDDAPLEERRARAISLRRTLPESQRDLGALDADAIERVVRVAAPAPRDADELHDVLMGLLVLPLHETAGAMLDELVAAGRARSIETPAGVLSLATENVARVEALYGDDNSDAHGDAAHAALRGYAEIAGPFTEASFASRLGIPTSSVAIAAARLEAEGFVLRGRFTPLSVAGGDGELCDRRLLARIHRLTLDRLRSEIEPVSAQDLMRFLLERHHLTQSARAAGRAGLRDAIGMLQGFEIAASAWETDILPARVAGYRPEWLDELCLSGEVAWARLSPRQTAQYTLASPSKATPIALTMRAELDWLLAAARADAAPEAPTLEAARQTLSLLERRGALFFHDLVSRTKLPALEVKDALWDLIGRGHATSDGFQPLRDLLAHGRSRVPAGRFALLARSEGDPLDAETLADRVAGQWLARYGVVFRDLIAREGSAVPWRDVARALRRREAKGLVRGGRFVSGFIGEQFAIPEAVDALRRIRKSPRTGEIVRIAAVDPLNLVGIILPGSRVAAHTGTWISYRDGALEGPLEEAS